MANYCCQNILPRKVKVLKQTFRIGTWNVQTLFQAGKLANVILEMKRLNISILGISEARWSNQGKIDSDDTTIIYSGGRNHMRGVAILLRSPFKELISGYYAVSDRILLTKLETKPFKTSIIQIYAPTRDSTEEEIEEF